MREIVIEGLRGSGIQGPSFICGLPESPVSDVRLADCQVTSVGGWTGPPQEQPEGYPAIKLHQPPPASALWIRHSADIVARNAVFGLERSDSRPGIRCDFSKNCSLESGDTDAPGAA